MITVSHEIAFATRTTNAADRVGKSLAKLSSGLRVNKASDDAGGLAISESLRTQVRGLAQAATNIQDAMNVLRIGEDGVNQCLSIVQRQRELVLQAANSTNDDTSLRAIQTEIDQMSSLIVNCFEQAFNSRVKLDGQPIDRILDFQVGANQGDQISVDFNSLRTTLREFLTTAMGYSRITNDPAASRFAKSIFGDPLPAPTDFVPPPPLFPPFPAGTTFDQAFPQVLIVEPNTPDNISSSLGVLDQALQRFTREQVYLGANNNRLENTLEGVRLGDEQQADAESRIRDADMADEMSGMTRAQILQQSATSVMAQATTRQASILKLIREAAQ